MNDIKKLADDADMIIDGYAFKKFGANIQVINLHNLKSIAVIDARDKVIETTMIDDEISQMMDYYIRNKIFMED